MSWAQNLTVDPQLPFLLAPGGRGSLTHENKVSKAWLALAVLSSRGRRWGWVSKDRQRVPGMQKAGAEARQSPLLENISKSQPPEPGSKEGATPLLAESTQGGASFKHTSWEP